MKTRLSVTNGEHQDTIIEMRDMKPWQVGCIVQKGDFEGDYVMRTASCSKLEIVNLSSRTADRCWTGPATIRVRLLRPNEKVTLTFTGE